MKWDENPLVLGDSPDCSLRGQLQLAMYAVHLSTGNTIFCKQIKTATIEQYLLAASTMIAHFTGLDHRKDNPSDNSMGHILGPVLKDLRKYESCPNGREPCDIRMHELASRLAKDHPPTTLIPALVDGFEQGLCAGYRLSEWAQPAGKHKLGTHQLNHLLTCETRTRAIVPGDIRCTTTSLGRAIGLDILNYPLAMITHIWVKWRTQKNGSHGEEKMFVRNSTPGGICMVSSLYRSLKRFRTLADIDGRIKESSTPLAIYYHQPSGSVRHITSSEIEGFMRELASKVYQLHPVKDAKDLQRWGTHSLRVGACVILHAMGFSPLDIQWILRWKSMAFMAHLRNIAMLSTRQSRAFDKAQAMPHLVTG